MPVDAMKSIFRRADELEIDEVVQPLQPSGEVHLCTWFNSLSERLYFIRRNYRRSIQPEQFSDFLYRNTPTSRETGR